MARQRFGSAHTAKKLEKLEAYLRAYSTALNRQSFRLIYFDAFAGTTDIQVADESALLQPVDDYTPFIKGSTPRALGLGTAFDQYVFVEKSRSKTRELDALRTQYPTIADRIAIRHADANAELIRFCRETDWRRSRAVVFLDPFGNQVKWTTIEAVAKTQAIDLWYLFPAGLGVYRQIGSDGHVHYTHEDSLDNLLGTREWREAFVLQTDSNDLFGPRKDMSKVVTPHSITLYMIKRLRMVFKGGVLDEWLPLGTKGVHMYSLLFAWSNPGPKAKLAGKLASAVLRNSGSGRIQ